MRRAYAITILAALALVMAMAAPASADPGGNDGSPNGANGTVKIHDWPDHKNSSEMANDPKVCQFEIHGFKFDAGESETWWIQAHKWGNGDRGKAVLTGSYTADGEGDWTSGPHSLADGHYKLFVEMEHGTFKHKVFKVDCPPPNAGEEGDEEGSEEEDEEGGSEENNDENTAGGQQEDNAVAGVQQPPMTGGASPTVESAAQPGAQAAAQVAGQQAAPVTALPSTSTAQTAPFITPLLLGIGMWLMRRRTGDR